MSYHLCDFLVGGSAFKSLKMASVVPLLISSKNSKTDCFSSRTDSYLVDFLNEYLKKLFLLPAGDKATKAAYWLAGFSASS